MVITPKGQRRAHFLQPVHAAASCNSAVFLNAWSCKLSTCGGHTATHQPQPVHRLRSISGNRLWLGMRMPPRHHPTQGPDQIGLGQDADEALGVINDRQVVVAG